MLDLFAAAIGGELASLATVQALVGDGSAEARVWLDGSGVAAALIYLWLSPAGVRALAEGRFDGREPDRAHLGRAHASAGVYAWACAGAGLEGRRAVMRAWAELKAGAFARLPFFARAATPAGRKALIERLHCLPVDETGGLLWAAPVHAPRRAA